MYVADNNVTMGKCQSAICSNDDLPALQSDSEVQIRTALLNDALSENEDACRSLKAQYDAFSYLWLTDM